MVLIDLTERDNQHHLALEVQGYPDRLSGNIYLRIELNISARMVHHLLPLIASHTPALMSHYTCDGPSANSLCNKLHLYLHCGLTPHMGIFQIFFWVAVVLWP